MNFPMAKTTNQVINILSEQIKNILKNPEKCRTLRKRLSVAKNTDFE